MNNVEHDFLELKIGPNWIFRAFDVRIFDGCGDEKRVQW